MEKPSIAREEIVNFLYHAYSQELIQLGRDAYTKWRKLYEGTEYDPPYSPTNRLTIGLRDILTSRENVLRRLAEQGQNEVDAMNKMQDGAGKQVVKMLSSIYPDREDELMEEFIRQQEEQNKQLKLLEERIRKFVS